MNFASGSQLAQSRPSGTTAVSAFTALMPTEITRIIVCNTTGTAANMSIYHDDDGSTFDATTALYESKSVPANDSIEIKAESIGAGLMMAKNGQIGVKTGTANALTFTIYGITANIAEKLNV